MVEPWLNRFSIYVNFKQRSPRVFGLRTVAVLCREEEMNADGCEDFNEYKPAEHC